MVISGEVNLKKFGKDLVALERKEVKAVVTNEAFKAKALTDMLGNLPEDQRELQNKALQVAWRMILIMDKGKDNVDPEIINAQLPKLKEIVRLAEELAGVKSENWDPQAKLYKRA